jgi:hypothetical protein
MRSDIVPRGVFPDYELPDHTGIKRRLSEFAGRGSADPHAGMGPLLPERTSAASATRRVLPPVSRRGLKHVLVPTTPGRC